MTRLPSKNRRAGETLVQFPPANSKFCWHLAIVTADSAQIGVNGFGDVVRAVATVQDSKSEQIQVILYDALPYRSATIKIQPRARIPYQVVDVGCWSRSLQGAKHSASEKSFESAAATTAVELNQLSVKDR